MKWILLVLALLMGSLLAVEWLVWKPAAPKIEVRQPPAGQGDLGQPGSDPQDLLELPPISDYRSIEERPLFVEGRRPLAEEAPEPPPPPPPPPLVAKTPPPALDLRGIMIVGQERIAFLGRPAEKDGETRLRAGSRIRDWTVTAIEAEQVVLENGGERTSIPLRKFAAVPLPAVPVPAAAAAPGAGAKRPPDPRPGIPQGR